MEPLVTIRQMLIWLCVFQAEEGTSKRRKHLYFATSLFVVTILLSIFATSVFTLLKLMSVDLEQSLYALMQTIAVFSTLNMMFNTFILRQKLKIIFEKLSEIYSERKNFIKSLNRTK